MGIASLIKSVLRRSDPPEVEFDEQPLPEETASKADIPAFNRGMPIEILKDFDTVLFSGRLSSISATELTIERIPGEMSFPFCEAGSEVLIRGYDIKVNPIILSAKIVRSSLIECVLGDWQASNYDNHRKGTRYPLDTPADIFALDDTRLSRPQPCQVVNISTGGACILSERSYKMGQTLRLWVEITEKSGHSAYLCQVVRITQRKEDLYEYGLLFAQLDTKKINNLMRDIQDIQKDTEKKLLS